HPVRVRGFHPGVDGEDPEITGCLIRGQELDVDTLTGHAADVARELALIRPPRVTRLDDLARQISDHITTTRRHRKPMLVRDRPRSLSATRPIELLTQREALAGLPHQAAPVIHPELGKRDRLAVDLDLDRFRQPTRKLDLTHLGAGALVPAAAALDVEPAATIQDRCPRVS